MNALLPNVEDDLGKILDFHGSNVTLRAVTETKDTYGRLKSIANSDTTVAAIIMPIRDLNIEQQQAGWINTENYVAFFKGTTGVNIRDKIIDGSITYIVRALKSHGFFSRNEYITAAEVERVG